MTESDSKNDLLDLASSGGKGGTCRACTLFYDTSRMIFLFESDTNLAEMFWKCTSLETSDADGLPKHICLNCHNDLINYNKFRLLCASSDTYFRRNINIKTDNSDKDNLIIKEDATVERIDVDGSVESNLDNSSISVEAEELKEST
ncbi:hypothetical protein Bhyg_16697, partial [Pseudolycoriella hygida]